MTPGLSGARGRTGHKDDVAEQSPAVRMDLGLSKLLFKMRLKIKDLNQSHGMENLWK